MKQFWHISFGKYDPFWDKELTKAGGGVQGEPVERACNGDFAAWDETCNSLHGFDFRRFDRAVALSRNRGLPGLRRDFPASETYRLTAAT